MHGYIMKGITANKSISLLLYNKHTIGVYVCVCACEWETLEIFNLSNELFPLQNYHLCVKCIFICIIFIAINQRHCWLISMFSSKFTKIHQQIYNSPLTVPSIIRQSCNDIKKNSCFILFYLQYTLRVLFEDRLIYARHLIDSFASN